MTFNSADGKFMRRALALAHRGVGLSSPNPTVGCVVVKAGRTVGEGFHRFASLDHAEVVAIQAAGDRAVGATVYLTLEPCSHFGRTPPCADLLWRAGVKRVVVAIEDPNPLVHGKGIALLRRSGIKVDLGLYSEKALRLNEPFGCFSRTGRPLVVSKVGMTMDGRIATWQRESRWITSPESRRFVQSLRLEMDAILIGIGTVLADNPALTYRESREKGRPLLRVVLDSKLRTPVRAKVCKETLETPTLIFCSPDASESRKRRLESEGVEVCYADRDRTGLNIRQVLDELAKRKILGVLVEGGGELHWSLLSRRMVDKFYFVIAPLVVGGRRAIPAVGGIGYAKIHLAPRFHISRSFFAGPDLVLETYPLHSRSIASPWLSPRTAPSEKLDSARSSRLK